ncbi:MAG: 50S ribosomal protein L9 [Chloroflexi bacterium]|nr:MAG: 50S ribosomal protein L9 [Chloroflexota bacterium]TMG01219.1 MAG: 50S ribosomal protein L9 [Chloroflexota bacterium]
MRVVFLEEVEGTARTGDVKNVADGFARNFLLPRKLAAPATDHYINIAQAKAGKEERRQEKVDEEARDRVLPKVDGKAVEIEVRVGEQGKLFGSVTARDIAEALQAVTRVELEHRQVDLKEPIRELGGHEVTIKVTRNVLATVTVNVVPVGGLPAEEAAEESPEVAIESEAEAEVSAASEELIEEEILEQEPPAEAGDAGEESADEELEKELENDSVET